MKTKVLVAEDSPTQQLQIQALLEANDYSVTVAANGREALEKVRLDQPEIVVTDMEMPEMNGLELVEHLQQEFPKLPVVLITAVGSEQLAASALKSGAASYVPKQEMESDLLPTLGRILAVLRVERAQDRLGQYIHCTDVEYLLDNDDSLVPFLIARLQEDMRKLGLANENELVQIATALDEALVNAIVHGNLEVSSELREIDNGEPYSLLIQQRRAQPPYNDRRVLLKVSANRERAIIVIRDDGPGFDPASVPDPTNPVNLEKVSGRGLLLIGSFMDEVTHNQKGNEITMVKRKT